MSAEAACFGWLVGWYHCCWPDRSLRVCYSFIIVITSILGKFWGKEEVEEEGITGCLPVQEVDNNTFYLSPFVLSYRTKQMYAPACLSFLLFCHRFPCETIDGADRHAFVIRRWLPFWGRGGERDEGCRQRTVYFLVLISWHYQICIPRGCVSFSNTL